MPEASEGTTMGKEARSLCVAFRAIPSLFRFGLWHARRDDQRHAGNAPDWGARTTAGTFLTNRPGPIAGRQPDTHKRRQSRQIARTDRGFLSTRSTRKRRIGRAYAKEKKEAPLPLFFRCFFRGFFENDFGGVESASPPGRRPRQRVGAGRPKSRRPLSHDRHR